MSEVLYWAEKLKSRWMEEKAVERNSGAYTLRQTEEGEECLSERCMELEEKQTGEYQRFGSIK